MITKEISFALSPEFQRLSPPILIIGMHRSGTSLVAGLLDILGVYIDPEMRRQDSVDVPSSVSRQNGYGEATSFRLLNEEIMAKSGRHGRTRRHFWRFATSPPIGERLLKR